MEEVFEPVTTKQAEASENQEQLSENQSQASETQLQALHDSSQTTRQAIENQTRAIKKGIQESSNNLQKNLQYYDEITNRNNQLLTSLVNSNQVDCSIVKTVSNLLNDKNKSQFSLEPITQDNPRSSANLFTINPSNPQPVLIEGSIMAFESGNSYDLNDPDLQYFITNTHFDEEINNLNLFYSFLNDMNYNINCGDKKSIRYYFIKDLYSRHQQLQSGLRSSSRISLHNYERSGLRSNLQSCTNQYVFLPSDPDELEDQLKLLYFGNVGGNDSFLLNEQIKTTVDKLLEYECITPSQHQNMRSTFDVKAP